MDNARNSTRKARSGFTLLEVMIVILIVLMLGGLVAYNLMGKKDKADDQMVQIQMNTIQQALKDFRLTHARYPTEEEGLAILWSKDAASEEETQKKWSKLLDKALPTDMYGNEWGYRQQSEHSEEDVFDLWSYGRDRTEGTDDDIVSWEKDEDGMGAGGGGGGSESGGGSGSAGG